ncbi:MAG: TraR/DksA family transcriptional regulator [Bdellovibrionales bacterium]|nr:TraR/DksA family transcriptional regulator [Bdellovibrionales bacterium]
MISEERFKEIIQELKTKINAEKGKQVYLNAVAGDNIDHTVSDRENYMGFKLESRKSIYLKKLQRSLDKVRNGTYGKCEDCDGPIESRRLKARPTASYCINCKEEQERDESHQLYQKKSHTLGKTFSDQNIIEFPKSNDFDNDKILPFQKSNMVKKLN